ncbi:tape measure protein [uncultured Megasphaera sp.]|uniref:tape measure protein n=1 Tax=uncultured Megasphaera sp. TaxID=165188 RepID=UPI00265842F6|nr:tape measure protein [uncultured Megasphaera sp.]
MGAVRELIVKIAFAFDSRGKKQADAAVNSTKRNMDSMAAEAGRAGGRLARSFLQAVPGANAAIRAIQRVRASLSGVRGVSIKPNVSGLTGQMEGIGGQATKLIGKFAALGAAIAAAFMAGKAAIQTADEMMNLDGRLRTLYEDEQQRLGVENRLYAMSQQNRQGLSEMGDLYFKVARAGKQYGMGMEDAARVTDVVSKALTVGGASAQEAQSTILQLGQALGSGVLQGDELRSLDENASLLMQHIADSMGVTIGDLKKMGSEGVLTSEAVMKAIIASGGAVDKEFGKMPVTFGQATTKLENFWKRFVWYVQSSTGVFGWVAQKLSDMVDVADTVMTLATGPQQGATPEETAANTAKYEQAAAENPQLVAIADGINQVIAALQLAGQYISDVFTPAIDMIKDHWDDIAHTFAPTIEVMQVGVAELGKAFEELKPILQVLMQIIGSALVAALYALFYAGSMVFASLAKGIRVVADVLSTVYNWVVAVADGISGLITKAQEFFGLRAEFDATGSALDTLSQKIINVNEQRNEFNLNRPQEVYPSLTGANTFFANS